MTYELWTMDGDGREKERYATKPPLGIKPEWLWKEDRVWELMRCLVRHDGSEFGKVDEWLDELRTLLDWLFVHIDKEKNGVE